MHTSETFSISFFIKKYKAKQNKAPVYARITVNGQRTELSTRLSVDMDNWNPGKGLARGSKDDVKQINTYLEQMRAELVRCYQEIKHANKPISSEAIKNKYMGIDDEQQYSLLFLLEYHNTHTAHTLEKGTLKNYHTTSKYCKLFLQEKYKRKDILLCELNYKFIADFEIWLKTKRPEKKHFKPCGHNGAMKHIERLNKMIHLAMKLDWIEKDPFIKFDSHIIRNDREFLTQEELERIEQKEFAVQRLHLIKDLFIFSCYTGASYQDVMNLTLESVTLGMDGMKWIYYKRWKIRNKVFTTVKVPLLPPALMIINKYKHHAGAIASGSLLPTISNQKLNAYLKEIADLCGITKNVTFHVARHTFATTVTLTNGIPVETVSSMLGHASLQTTQIYAKVVEEKVSHEMSQLMTKFKKTERLTGT